MPFLALRRTMSAVLLRRTIFQRSCDIFHDLGAATRSARFNEHHFNVFVLPRLSKTRDGFDNPISQPVGKGCSYSNRIIAHIAYTYIIFSFHLLKPRTAVPQGFLEPLVRRPILYSSESHPKTLHSTRYGRFVSFMFSLDIVYAGG